MLQTEKLVDVLFEAARTAVARRAVWVVNYVGDGVSCWRARRATSRTPRCTRSRPWTRNSRWRRGQGWPPGRLATEHAAADLPEGRVSLCEPFRVRGVDEPLMVAAVAR
jgi:class 3 adenylate cyclase